MDVPDLLLIATAYLLGSICTGYFLVKGKTGEDIRTFGSGGVGATNVGRKLGRAGFICTLLGDGLKGVAAVWLVPGQPHWAMVAVVAGHVWPLFLGFRGGRGVATAFGALLVLQPLLLVPIILVTTFTKPLIKKFTLAGLIGFATLPFTALLLNQHDSLLPACIAVTGIIFYAHKGHLHHAFTKKAIH